jgi:hypothetical protein
MIILFEGWIASLLLNVVLLEFLLELIESVAVSNVIEFLLLFDVLVAFLFAVDDFEMFRQLMNEHTLISMLNFCVMLVLCRGLDWLVFCLSG